MPDASSADSLAKFAASHGLTYAERVDLPLQGATLAHSDGKVEGAATGALPGGIEGSLVYFTYTYTYTDSDDHTHTVTRRFTLAVTQVPESIGFLPYMGFSGSGSELGPMAGSAEMRSTAATPKSTRRRTRTQSTSGWRRRWGRSRSARRRRSSPRPAASRATCGARAGPSGTRSRSRSSSPSC